MEQIGQNFGFDQQITNDWIGANASSREKKEIQDEGRYKFIISNFVKKNVKGGKYQGAQMAELEFTLGGTKMKTWLILNMDFKQKIASFLKAVFGAENPPAGFWDQLVGREVGIYVNKVEDSFTNDEGKVITFMKNEVRYFLDKTLEHEWGAVSNPTVKELPKQEPAPSFGGSATGNSAIPPMNDDLPF